LLYSDIYKLLKHTSSLGFYNLLLTTDGELLTKKQKILPFLDAVRFSVHAISSKHDEIVGYPGSFMAIDKAIDLLNDKKTPAYVTTVVTPINVDYINDIADWCLIKKVKKYFLFGLMRSGLGNNFIKKYGNVLTKEIPKIASKLKKIIPQEQMEIICYEYRNNAECILIYGDGRVVIDPYLDSKSFQLDVGNVFSDTRDEILNRFNKDPKNSEGYRRHLKKFNNELK
jgi:MoaA/NifB/PqqE/SkfB family radical SAM enzyme